MHLKNLLLLLLLSCKLSFAGQQAYCDTILAEKFSKFIPEGYALLDTVSGDLNLDSYPDMILVLKKIGEDTASDATGYKRPLLLLSGNAGKSFTLAARNDNIVYCRQCGGVMGDPYYGIEIKKGMFTVNHFGGSTQRWSNEITFKYSPVEETWLLYEITDKNWNVFDEKTVETHLKTKNDFGVVRFEEYSREE